MTGLEWRAPGSDRVLARPSWSPLTVQRSSVEADPFRRAPISPSTSTAQAFGRDIPELALRPGIIPLRPLRLGDVFGGVVRAVRGNVGSTMGLAAGTTMVFLVPITALAAWLGSQTSLSAYESSSGLLSTYLPTIGTWFSSILLAAFMAYVIGQGVLGRKVAAKETVRHVMRRIGQLLLATTLVVGSSLLVVGVGVVAVVALVMIGSSSNSAGAGALLLGLFLVPVAIVVGLALQTYFSFTTSVVVLERLPAVRAIARSWRLVGPPTRKGFWRLLGIRLLTSVAAGIIGQVVATPMTLIGAVLLTVVAGQDVGGVYYAAMAVLQGAVAILSGILTTPFIAGVDAMLYIDARIRQEALDVQLLHAGTGGRAAWLGA
jgi:hypothetical protein